MFASWLSQAILIVHRDPGRYKYFVTLGRSTVGYDVGGGYGLGEAYGLGGYDYSGAMSSPDTGGLSEDFDHLGDDEYYDNGLYADGPYDDGIYGDDTRDDADGVYDDGQTAGLHGEGAEGEGREGEEIHWTGDGGRRSNTHAA